MSVHADRYVTRSVFAVVEFPPLFAPHPAKGMEMALEECEAWDAGASLLPPVTRLYHLPPIGLGTPMVESLTGYVVRLAEEHCVSAGVLYRKEIRALAAKGNIFTFRVTNNAGYSTHTINGLGSPAADFVRAMETLTGRRDLSCLTLLAWRWVLCSYSLLRRCRAWCERCFYAWQEAKQPIYEPLLWLSPSARTIAGSCAKHVHIAGVRLVLSTHVPGPIAVRAVGARSCPERSIRPRTAGCCQARTWRGLAGWRAHWVSCLRLRRRLHVHLRGSVSRRRFAFWLRDSVLGMRLHSPGCCMSAGERSVSGKEEKPHLG